MPRIQQVGAGAQACRGKANFSGGHPRDASSAGRGPADFADAEIAETGRVVRRMPSGTNLHRHIAEGLGQSVRLLGPLLALTCHNPMRSHVRSWRPQTYAGKGRLLVLAPGRLGVCSAIDYSAAERDRTGIDHSLIVRTTREFGLSSPSVAEIVVTSILS